MEALDLHDHVVDACAALLAGGDESSSWRLSEGWGLRTFELGYWANGAHRNRPGAEGTPVPDLSPPDHPFHAIVKYAESLEANGIDFLIVPIPGRLHVYPERLPGIEQQAADFRGVDVVLTRYLAALAEAGVEIVDLLPIFAEQRFTRSEASDELLYHAFDRHWTPRGAKLAAQAIAARVRALPWFEPGSLKESRDFVVERERSPWISKKKASLPEMEETVELWFERVLRASDRTPLLEVNRESPILILGDSFLNHLENEGAGVGSLLTAELRQQVDRIALGGGGSVAVWQSLARRADGLVGKRVVIWLSSSDQLTDPRVRFVDLFAK